jgi:chorismate mutase/prephenate dehydratase
MPNAKLNEIKRVYSHPQALGQCARFLDRELTFATQIATRSTADSLKEIKSVYDAGIVGSHCDVGELVKTDYCISDLQTNYTQFLLLERVELAEPVHSNKVYFTAACRHEPGALWKLLSVLNEFNLNMTKIGSRPIKEQAWEYRFFIELEADFASLNVQKAIVEIKKMADFKLLGVY